MAYAYKKRGRIYIGYVDASGKPQRERCRAAQNLTQAKRIAQDRETQQWNIAHGIESAVVPSMLFEEVTAKYLEVQAPTLRSFDTIKQRLEDHVLPALGKCLVGQIKAVDIQALLNSKAKAHRGKDGKVRKKLGPQTRQHVLNHIQAVFSFAVEQLRVARENPAAEVDRVFIPEHVPRVLEHEWVAAIIAHVPDRWRGLFAVAVYTGLRKGELLGLRVKNVRLEEGFITVAHSYDGPRKNGKVHDVPIPPELVPYLKVELGRVRSEYLFPSLKGGLQKKHCNLPRTMRNAMKAAGIIVGYDHVCRRAGCEHVERQADDAPRECPKCKMKLWPSGVAPDFSFKDLRSTCATFSYEATGDIRYVSKLLGHSGVQVTEKRYAKMRDRRMLQQASKLSFSTHPALTEPAPDAATAGTRENFPQESPPLGAARGRGLEPLTSGVTGRVVALPRLTQASQTVDRIHESAEGGSSQVLAVAQVSAAFTHPALTAARLVEVEGEGTRYLSVGQVAERLGLTPQTVYLLIGRGELVSVRQGGRHLIAESSLPAPAGEALLSVAEVAEKAGVPEKRVRKWVEKGRLPVTRVGGVLRIRLEQLNEFLLSKRR
jgi:integrase